MAASTAIRTKINHLLHGCVRCSVASAPMRLIQTQCSLVRSTTMRRLKSFEKPSLMPMSSYSTQQLQTQERDTLYKTIDIEVKGHDPTVIDSYEKFLKLAAAELDIHIENIWSPPKDISQLSVLKSVHVYKKHFVQYEARTHYRCVQLKRLTGSTADTFLEFIQRNVPEGMAMKVSKTRIEPVPDHLKPPQGNNEAT